MINPEEILLYAALAQNFNMFLEKCYNEIDGGQKYTETIATELTIDKLNCVSNGDIKRLIINVPPRTLKTTIVSIAYTAWLLGHNPKLKILCISYGDDLAKEFSFKTRQIMQSEWYKKTFLNTRLKKGRQQDDFFETTKNGFRKATSLGGSLTGHGADIIIIDDPQKAQEILSDKIRKSSNETFSNTIISRLNNKNEGKIILVAQRLHLDDFSNYVQKFGKWDVLALPAIAEGDETYTLSDDRILRRKVGDVINPELESLNNLEEIREGMGEFNFSAQYQQNPIPTKGNIINFDDFQFYESIPVASEGLIMQSWDVAMKTGDNNDFSVCITAQIINKVAYILDICRYKFDFTNVLAQVKIMQTKYGAQSIIIEDAGVSIPLIQLLRNDEVYVIPYHPTISKVERASACTYMIRSHRVLLPKAAPWLDCFKSEVLAFPFGVHDDQVDAFSQLIEEINNIQNNYSIVEMAEAMKRSEQKAPEEQFWQKAITGYKNKPIGWKPPF
ncbi:MAG: phage terminase large subunit [Candidatus Gastranaerophilales bacterium]|nr:phage terminase large subunit [Candidatus Gastranaerophilales bacterium]